MVSLLGKLKDRLYIDLPDIEAEADKMDRLIENYSLGMARELCEYWIMTCKDYEKINVDVNTKYLEEHKRVKAEKLEALYELKECMMTKMNALTADDYREADRRRMLKRWSKQNDFLVFVEDTLNRYGRLYKQETREKEKDHIKIVMGGLIKDLNNYFDVYEYDDLFKLDSHELRLRIAGLHRLFFDIIGVDYINPPKINVDKMKNYYDEPITKEKSISKVTIPENSLTNLL